LDEEELDAMDAHAPTACSFAVQHISGKKGSGKSTTTTPKKGQIAAVIARRRLEWMLQGRSDGRARNPNDAFILYHFNLLSSVWGWLGTLQRACK
jgi:hypothetical protein